MIRSKRYAVLCVTLILAFPLLSYSGIDSPSDALLTPERIVSRAVERTRLRDNQSKRYSVDRTYEIKGDDKKEPSIINSRMVYTAPPAAKDFKVLSKTNGGTVANLVYEHAIKAEKEALNPKNEAASTISPDNYNISLQGVDVVMDTSCYVLDIVPRRNDPMLIKGRVWISKSGFDTVRIDGTLVKSPSIWIKKMSIVRQFQNIDGFWFPKDDISTVDVRIFGEVKVQIHHQNYDIKK